MNELCKHGIRDTETNLPYCRHCDAEAKSSLDPVRLFGVVVQHWTDEETKKPRITIEMSDQEMSKVSTSLFGKMCRIEVLEIIPATPND